MRILAFLSALLLAGWTAAQPSGPSGGVNHPGATAPDAPASPPATGPGTSAVNPGSSSGSGTAPRGPQTAADDETLEGVPRDAARDEEQRRRLESGRIDVPGAGGTPESLPLRTPMPGVPAPAQGAPGEGPAETGPRDRTLRPGG